MRTSHLQVVLAHVDRYFKLSSKELLERLMDEGVIFQFNAGFSLMEYPKKGDEADPGDGWIFSWQ